MRVPVLTALAVLAMSGSGSRPDIRVGTPPHVPYGGRAGPAAGRLSHAAAGQLRAARGACWAGPRRPSRR